MEWNDNYEEEIDDIDEKDCRALCYEMKQRFLLKRELVITNVPTARVASAPWLADPDIRPVLQRFAIDFDDGQDTEIVKMVGKRKVRKVAICGTLSRYRHWITLIESLSSMEVEDLTLIAFDRLTLMTFAELVVSLDHLQALTIKRCELTMNDALGVVVERVSPITRLVIDLCHTDTRNWSAFPAAAFILCPNVVDLEVILPAGDIVPWGPLLVNAPFFFKLKTLRIVSNGACTQYDVLQFREFVLQQDNGSSIQELFLHFGRSELQCVLDVIKTAHRHKTIRKFDVFAAGVHKRATLDCDPCGPNFACQSVRISIRGKIPAKSTPGVAMLFLWYLRRPLKTLVWNVHMPAASFRLSTADYAAFSQHARRLIFAQSTQIRDHPNIFDYVVACTKLDFLGLGVDFEHLGRMSPITAHINGLVIGGFGKPTLNRYNLLAAMTFPDQLQKLSLSHIVPNAEHGKALATQLARMPNVTSLDLEFVPLPSTDKEEFVDYLAPLQQLEKLTLTGLLPAEYRVAFFNAVAQLPRIAWFDFYDIMGQTPSERDYDAIVAMAKSTPLIHIGPGGTSRQLFVRAQPHLLRNTHNAHHRSLGLLDILLDDVFPFNDPVRRYYAEQSLA